MKICKDPKGSRKAVFGGDLTGSFETEHKNLGPARYADQEEFTEEFGMMSGPVLGPGMQRWTNQDFSPQGTYQLEVDRNNLNSLWCYNRSLLHSGVEGLSIVLGT